MDSLQKEPYGPQGSPSFHQSLVNLREGLGALPSFPKNNATVDLVCQRLADGTRKTPFEAHLSVTHGLLGDGWYRRPPRDPLAQITVMNTDVAKLVANSQDLALFGDNIFTNLDLSSENLPAGTELLVGTARVVVTPEPHNGCAKFSERFGLDAFRFVQDSRTRHRNLRGLHWRVIEDGEIHQQSPIRVLSRPRNTA